MPLITKCKSYLFADDTTLLLSHNNTAQLELNLNLELEKIQNWMKGSKLTINYTKTKFILFSKIFLLISPTNLSCGVIPIEQVESIKYPGVVIDSRLIWELHIDHVGKNVVCGNAELYKLQPYVNVDLLRKLDFSIVYCHLYYAILFLGAANKTLLDFLVKLNNRAVRNVCKIHTNEEISIKYMHLSTYILEINNIYKYELGK